MLLKENAVCYEIRSKHAALIHCWGEYRFLNVKSGGTYSYHCTFKGYFAFIAVSLPNPVPAVTCVLCVMQTVYCPNAAASYGSSRSAVPRTWLAVLLASWSHSSVHFRHYITLGKVNGKGRRVFPLQIHLFTKFLIIGYVDTLVYAASCMLHAGALQRYCSVFQIQESQLHSRRTASWPNAGNAWYTLVQNSLECCEDGNEP